MISVNLRFFFLESCSGLALLALLSIVAAGVKHPQRRQRANCSIVIMERHKISAQVDTCRNFPLKYTPVIYLQGEINLPQSSFEMGDEVTRRELTLYSHVFLEAGTTPLLAEICQT